MPIVIQFPSTDKLRRCSECGQLFTPRERHHRFCLPCFKADQAIRALATATKLWNELVGGGGR